MEYATNFGRFATGDFPMVCARSGLPATEMVKIPLIEPSGWWRFFLPEFSSVAITDYSWGFLPFAEGHIRGVSATHDKRRDVVLKGVHENFVAAVRDAEENPA